MKITRRTALGALGVTASGLTSVSTSDSSEMLRGFACNMESWWTDEPFLRRFEKAAEAGFTAVEFWPTGEGDRDPARLVTHCKSLGLNIVQFTGWGSPSLADPANHDAFIDAMKRAVDVAGTLDAPMFTIVGHQVVDGIDHASSVDNIRRVLERAAPILEAAGKMAILEPFNPVDHVGHVLNGSADGLAICRVIDSPAIKLNWDLYHMQLTEGNLVHHLKDGMDQVGYIQVADVPGRNQPGTGELNYTYIFESIRSLGYSGPIGLECWPRNNDAQAAISDLVAALSD